jgi:hypothetical protein
VRTPKTRANFDDYKKKNALNPVADGGWYKIEKDATAALGKVEFERIRPNLDASASVVQAGGWYKLQQVAADPKGALVELIKENLKSGCIDSSGQQEELQAILVLLQAQGKGFSADLVDGEWCSVLNISGKKSPSIQKLVATKERAGASDSNFDVSQNKFFGRVQLFGGPRSEIRSTVKYRPVGTGFSKIGNSIVIRRIMCDIVAASIKLWRFPRIPLPFLRRKGGYLDFIYLDSDMRVTKGNRGGVFVHFRPAFLEKVLKE